ncbi:hypothetical protein [Actinomadura violacea]|uniref:Uncharacterized protein n=1 Tax=Actinomadura violacea TaxID=2819934 RepID=A0ABS3S2J7_9ACTN|nr:hypothetical protein [Actinomadura violacea]MBO2463215.1 hypothetical protein [Actinomadura violacea]
MGKGSGRNDAEADVQRRVKHVGTGASGNRGTLAEEAATDGARKDVERRVKHLGTGATGTAGDAVKSPPR